MDNEELTLFRDMAHRALETEISPHIEQWEAQRMVPRQLWSTLGQAGLLCPDMPEQYGAAGANPNVTFAVIEEMSRMGFGGIASGYAIHSNIVAPYIDHFGTEEQKSQWLPNMVTGEALGALAMTEPSAGSDVQSIRTKAVKDGDRLDTQRLQDFYHQWHAGRYHHRCGHYGSGQGCKRYIAVYCRRHTAGLCSRQKN